MVDFASAVADWESRLIGTTAEGYFRICIRKHPDVECWSFALEWNMSMRVIGFMGERDFAQKIVDSFSKLEFHRHSDGQNRWVKYRLDVPLKEEDDRLFEVNEL